MRISKWKEYPLSTLNTLLLKEYFAGNFEFIIYFYFTFFLKGNNLGNIYLWNKLEYFESKQTRCNIDCT